ncbi:MAG: GTPase HflX [Planctomycetota bacterium]
MPEPRERQTIDVRSERAVVAAVRLPGSIFDPQEPFGEITELARQAGAIVVGEMSQNRDRPEAGTYMGRGKLAELRDLCEALDARTIIFDHELAPKQIAKIEEITERKVIDRSELILDIFAGRATTHEAKLQVELAQLNYTYPRLRAMWSHLERIVGAGGIGGVGTRGPGEQQIEIDRRLVQRRRVQLERELEGIRERKSRSVRERNRGHFTVGLVGYTNAGKSTLFNTLTAGGAYADDRLFATLVTRTRAWDLGGGEEVMISDTVGFVRELPHHLIASFRATLEEATHADLLLVVLDVSDRTSELMFETVNHTLDELFEEVTRIEGDDWTPPERVLLLNKADQLTDNRELLVWQSRVPDAIPICSLPDDEGLPRIGGTALTQRVRTAAAGPTERYRIRLPMSAGKTMHELETKGVVLDRAYAGNTATVTVEIGSRLLERLRIATPGLELLDHTDEVQPEKRPAWRGVEPA